MYGSILEFTFWTSKFLNIARKGVRWKSVSTRLPEGHKMDPQGPVLEGTQNEHQNGSKMNKRWINN